MNLYDCLNSFYYDLSLKELRMMNEASVMPHISYNSLLYLDLIYCTPSCTASLLAERLHISKPAVTAKVNELIRQGLVTKTQSEQDKRVHYLHVSSEVREDNKMYDKRLRDAVALLQAKYTTEQLATLCDMLDLVRETILEEK